MAGDTNAFLKASIIIHSGVRRPQSSARGGGKARIVYVVMHVRRIRQRGNDSSTKTQKLFQKCPAVRILFARHLHGVFIRAE